MKTILLAALLAATLSFCNAIPTAPDAAEPQAEGLYTQSKDEAGNTITYFAPWDGHSLGNTTIISNPVPDVQRRSVLGKRREDCSGSMLALWKTDEANRQFLANMPGDNLDLRPAWGYMTRTWWVYSNALSFVCAYNAGWKPKTSIAGTFAYVKGKCGREGSAGGLGYAQVLEGSGDWTAGYTYDGDSFCW